MPLKRVVILGPGASGKSTLARRLSEITALPLIELDKVFWRGGLEPTPLGAWRRMQEQLGEQSTWIMDGDLGPYDDASVRLRAADTIILLDVSIIRCVWRALRRSRERWDFWRWLLGYRSAAVRRSIAEFAPTATLHVFRNPKEVAAFIEVIQQIARIKPE